MTDGQDQAQDQNTGTDAGTGVDLEKYVPVAAHLKTKEKLTALETELQAIKDANAEAERQRLAEQGQFKELNVGLTDENKTLKEQLTAAQSQLNAIEDAKRAEHEAMVSKEQWDKIKDWPVQQQAVFVSELTTQKPPADPGRPGHSAGNTYETMTYPELGSLVSRGDLKAREELERRNKGGR